MIKRLLAVSLGIALLCQAGCQNNETKNTWSLDVPLQPSLGTDATNSVNSALESFMANTPYSALVANMSIIALDIPDSDPDDYYDEVTYLYSAKVLETFRGVKVSQVEYKLTSEAGENKVLDKTPYILTLCKSEDGYYWPAIGASLPATTETVQKARVIGKTLDIKQSSFSDCE